MPASKVSAANNFGTDARLSADGGLFEFDSKNDIVLDPDPGDRRVALLGSATYVDAQRPGPSIQQVSL